MNCIQFWIVQIAMHFLNLIDIINQWPSDGTKFFNRKIKYLGDLSFVWLGYLYFTPPHIRYIIQNSSVCALCVCTLGVNCTVNNIARKKPYWKAVCSHFYACESHEGDSESDVDCLIVCRDEYCYPCICIHCKYNNNETNFDSRGLVE